MNNVIHRFFLEIAALSPGVAIIPKTSWIITVGIIAVLLSFYSCAKKETTLPPNIVFLLTDDQRWDTMGSMGNSDVQTPEMDKLAAEGV